MSAFLFTLFTVVFTYTAPFALGCSNVLVTPGASADGTAMVGDNDDSSGRHGLVTRFAAADHAKGAMRQVYDFETGRRLGEIPEPPHTYNVIAHANEKGLVIGETTHGGLQALSQVGKDYRNGTILDYGSLIHTTLQRAGTAREAVATIANLTNAHGYSSSMEGFSITDGKEVWYMELIGKGDYGTGIVWVALRVPDGYVTAHANQARITTFLPCDPDTCMMAPDTVTFAIDIGLYKGHATDPTFSFSDTYDPVTVTGARFCEARVWYVFSQIADPKDFSAEEYLPYAQGFNLSKRMPLWVRPKEKLTRATVHKMLSSHYEHSWLDPSQDVGAGAEASPYRWNGLSWKVDGKSYVNERIVGTQFTAWHYVASVKNESVPEPMRAVVWWGSDDHAWAPKVPIHGGATGVDKTYDDGNCSARLACRHELGLPGSMMDFSWDSAYWVNSAVAKLVYSDKARAAPVVECARQTFEDWVAPVVAESESQALERLHAGDAAGAVAALTESAVKASKEANKQWTDLWGKLMVKFNDGMTAVPDEANLLCGCKKKSATFSDEWLRKIVADTGDHYRMPGADCEYVDADGHCHGAPPTIKSAGDSRIWKTIPKVSVPGVAPALEDAPTVDSAVKQFV